MPLFSLNRGESVHFGGGSEYLRVTVGNFPSAHTALMHVSGIRGSHDKSDYRLRPRSIVLTPMEDSSEQRGELWVIQQIFSMRSHANHLLLAFIGSKPGDIGDIKVVLNELYIPDTIEIFVSAAPQIPCLTEKNHRKVMRAIQTGKRCRLEQSRRLLEQWLERHPLD